MSIQRCIASTPWVNLILSRFKSFILIIFACNKISFAGLCLDTIKRQSKRSICAMRSEILASKVQQYPHLWETRFISTRRCKAHNREQGESQKCMLKNQRWVYLRFNQAGNVRQATNSRRRTPDRIRHHSRHSERTVTQWQWAEACFKPAL